MHKFYVQAIVWKSSIYDHFLVWPSTVTLTFKTYLNKYFKWHFYSSRTTIVPNYQIILKSMHKCTTYGPDNLSLWPFYHLTFKSDLDRQPTWTNVSNGTSAPQGQQLCQIILKYMHKCASYGRLMHNACITHAHTLNWSCDNYVFLTASRLDKKTKHIVS